MISSFAAVVGFARDGKVRRIAISSATPLSGRRRPADDRRDAAGLRDRRLAGGGGAGRHAARHPRAAQPGDRPVPAQARCPAAAQHFGAGDRRRQHAGDDRGLHPARAGAWRAIAQELNPAGMRSLSPLRPDSIWQIASAAHRTARTAPSPRARGAQICSRSERRPCRRAATRNACLRSGSSPLPSTARKTRLAVERCRRVLPPLSSRSMVRPIDGMSGAFEIDARPMHACPDRAWPGPALPRWRRARTVRRRCRDRADLLVFVRMLLEEHRLQQMGGRNVQAIEPIGRLVAVVTVAMPAVAGGQHDVAGLHRRLLAVDHRIDPLPSRMTAQRVRGMAVRRRDLARQDHLVGANQRLQGGEVVLREGIAQHEIAASASVTSTRSPAASSAFMTSP